MSSSQRLSRCDRGASRDRPARRTPATKPTPKTAAGRNSACHNEGRAATCSTVAVAPTDAAANTTTAVTPPTNTWPASAIRPPARAPNSAVTKPIPRSAIVTLIGSAAAGIPRPVASSGSSVNVTSTPWPSSQMSTAARQKTVHSGENPKCAAQTIVSGTSGIAMPIATTSSASRAARNAVSRRVTARPYPAVCATAAFSCAASAHRVGGRHRSVQEVGVDGVVDTRDALRVDRVTLALVGDEEAAREAARRARRPARTALPGRWSCRPP